MIAAIRRGGARFSVTARQDAAVKPAIAGIGEDAWTTIRYPQAVFDEQLQQWVSDAQVAEVPSPRSPPADTSTQSPLG